jgi:hypothetical protein
MKRYYISNLIGDGSEDNPYRPAIEDLFEQRRLTGRASYVYPPQDPATGAYQGNWVLVILAARNHTPAVADRRNDPMPDVPLDVATNAVGQAQQAALSAALSRRGIAIGNLWSSEGYRSVVRRIGRQLNPAFDENDFDVLDVT